MDTLIQIWETYKGEIIPALVTAFIGFIPFFVLWVKNRLALSNKKQEAQLEVMKQIANKEDTRPELETLKEEISLLKEEIQNLKGAVSNSAVLFNTAFQNSDLKPEVKDFLESLKNKILVGNNEDLISALEEKLKAVEEEYENFKKSVAEEISEKELEQNPVKKQRKIRR